MTIALKISQTGHSSSSSSNSNININGNNNINKSVNCDTIIKDKSVWWQPQFMSKEYQPVLQHSPRTLIKDSEDMAKEQVTRKWEVFAGRNRFYCNGRLMTAPHSGMFLLTVFLITGTSVLFFIYDCTYLAVNVTIAIPIIGGLLFLFTISALLRTSLTDPGIIPRATFEEAAYVEKQIEVTNSANSPTYRPPPRTKEVLVKGQTVKLKYCFTCKIFRPPRASHCSLCDNCVDRFDHHCPWVGNCVGRRNYRFFYMFIVSLAFLAVFIFACAIAHLILISKEDGQFLEAVKASPASMVVALICFFSVWSILGLAGFHTYLTTSNQTTNEDIKGSFASKRGQDPFNPYSQGNVCLNCLHILCGPIGPSLIDRRGLVTDEYKLEVSKNATITIEPSLPLKPYGAVAAAAALQNGPHLASEIAGVYRQTTENTGTYAPIKKQLQRAHQVTPAGGVPLNPSPIYSPRYYYYDGYAPPRYHQQYQYNHHLQHIDHHRYCAAPDRYARNDVDYDEYAAAAFGGGGGRGAALLGEAVTTVAAAAADIRNSNSLPQSTTSPLPPPPPPVRCVPSALPNIYSTNFDRYFDGATTARRPNYTPPEKRYSSTFGLRQVADRPQRRPHSGGFVYRNVHATEEEREEEEDLCNSNECQQSGARSRQGIYSVANVKSQTLAA
ncbi:PREDICTED: probable palmitoyltransferase ZDHHC14 isoform X2 [Nicrophorus vespilloides]|uniref:Palmitoyltransferase n=1 Tax=Nicrophorus vespilloides TaxID=110193 RepID=A0ABM1M5J5_NICVS|nr:PREDICTED: probable palmitoyltransferase ZDHHC14 isoform X2 [Nicrophorus vespilloides]